MPWSLRCEGYKNYALGQHGLPLALPPIPRLVSVPASHLVKRTKKAPLLYIVSLFLLFLLVVVVVIVVVVGLVARLPHRCSPSTPVVLSLVLAQINSHSLLITAYNLSYY